MKRFAATREVSRRGILQVCALGAGGGVAATLFGSGCRSGQPVLVDFSETTRAFLASDYPDVLGRWTRHERLVSANEGTIIEMWGTLKSWEFREAYVEKYAQVYALSPAEKSALLASELKKSKSGYEMHLTVQTSDYRANDLDKRESPWRLSLVDGTGDELFKNDIEALRLPISYEEVFFPEKTSFSRAYTVVFDRESIPGGAQFGGSATGEIALRVRGPLGGVELTWQST
jgi:hypothetical protein